MVRLFLCSLVCLASWFLIVPATAQAQQWNRFRGPDGSGVVPADLPTTWSETEHLAWKTDLPGKGSSSPVVWNNRVFLTAYTGYAMDVEAPGDRDALMLHVLCLSLDDGKLIWDCPVKPAAEEQALGKRVAEHGYASPTPCVDDSGVYAFFGPSGIVAVSHDGDIRWRRSLGTQAVGFGAAASPILYQDLVIQNASIESGTLFGLDQSTGETRWQADGITKAWTTPTLIQLESGSVELVLNQQDTILGFDPATGQRLWNCDGIDDYVVPCVVAQDGLLYCSGGRSNQTVVVRPGGRGDVSQSHLVWHQSRGANVTSPIVVGDHLYWSHDKSIALCLRTADGEEMFRERMPTRSRVYGSIVSDGSKLFLTTRDKGVLVLAAAPEYKELAVNVLGDDSERFNATPAIVGNRLLLRSDKRLYCIE
ncbi:PQQ-like beta-propeller repeat protein [Stieleria sp. TO1_6]|uniref:outer membrane protein assembly factor BamB family protein n=1 Tax=Stieleria tagensis TaxID=2956795 RepID=UPI00209ACCA2|nr:PQQ-binding-like beta-propeller repeat protein [Stieleria tagensis]MCO8122965.1 PQQ-like beta-propeller repeat protein [Stieleria tagensis]